MFINDSTLQDQLAITSPEFYNAFCRWRFEFPLDPHNKIDNSFDLFKIYCGC